MYYYVQPGDSLHSIAMQYDTTVRHLMDLNPQIRDFYRLYVGERIRVSSGDYWGYHYDRHWGHDEYRRGREEYHRGREEYRRGRAEYRRGREEYSRHHGR